MLTQLSEETKGINDRSYMDRLLISASEIAAIEAGLAPGPIVGVARDVPAGTTIEAHSHGWGQLMFSSSGVMLVESRGLSWVVWPERGVWVPEGVEHTFHPITGISLRNLLVQQQMEVQLPQSCCFVKITPLLRELVLRVTEQGRPFRNSSHKDRLMQLAVDEMEICPAAPLQLRMPKDTRLLRICQILRFNPSDMRTLDDWAEVAGASARTLSRLFIKETGLSFAHWRRQARLISAMVLLGEGKSVTTAALDVGYESTSAFIEMFKRRVGQTPGQYVS
ncbi:helix-turn-helix transcriptional regulator [Bradyrhizobium sp. 33ap4]|uniref:AraC family transcriptional regulator n=1 Tax=Bradyrhizobium sp. 33ap4 TaxID=3061630 RepID=UPI00292EF773|nr:helix-turn-helix transcriptional regulator [Bradyrhizobium sp. 33ap4]